MKRAAMISALVAAAMTGTGCESAVQKVVDGTITVAGKIITSEAGGAVIETTGKVAVAVVEGTVVVAGAVIDAEGGGGDRASQCMESVDAYADSACESDCDNAKRDGDAAAIDALCPSFAR